MSQYVRERWGTERGFPRGAIHAITQTSDGYLWIGTEEGLVRFDGVQFRLIRDTPETGDLGGVVGLAPDPTGGLWVRLQDLRLFRYREGKVSYPLSQFTRMPSAMTHGRDGELLVAHGQDGVSALLNDRVKLVARAHSIPRSPVLALAQTGDGKYWLGTRGAGLFLLDNGNTTQLFRGLPDPKVNCLLADGDKSLWIGTDSGLVLWNGSELIAQIPELKPHQILALVKDRDRNLWVGTDAGDVFRVNAKGLTALNPERKQPSFAVTAFFEDREGSLWIGSANGLERLRDSAFVTYSAPEGVPTDGSNPIFVDSSDRLWFAPVTGGLWWWKEGLHGKVVDSGLEHDIVYSITGAPDGLWLGRQRGGITHLSVAGTSFVARTLTAKDGLAQNSIYSVYQDRGGNLWGGTLSGGVSKWDGSHFQTYTIAHGLASNTVSANPPDGARHVVWHAHRTNSAIRRKMAHFSYSGWPSFRQCELSSGR